MNSTLKSINVKPIIVAKVGLNISKGCEDQWSTFLQLVFNICVMGITS